MQLKVPGNLVSHLEFCSITLNIDKLNNAELNTFTLTVEAEVWVDRGRQSPSQTDEVLNQKLVMTQALG